MSYNPLVSVIIPAFNHEKFIQETIMSIINQTYDNLELIIIDDGSKDSTYLKILELKEKCYKRFKNFYFERQKNRGTCITFNKLFHLANGEFVYTIASDDFAAPDAIEILIKNFNSDDVVMSVGDNYIVDSNSNLISWDRDQNAIPYGEGCSTFFDFFRKYYPIDMEEYGSYGSLLNGNYITNGQLVRKSVVLKAGGFTKKAPLEDLYINLQLAKAGKISFIDKPLFYYRWHSNNTVKNKDKMSYMNRKTLFYEYIKEHRNKQLSKIFQNSFNISEHVDSLVSDILKTGSKKSMELYKMIFIYAKQRHSLKYWLLFIILNFPVIPGIILKGYRMFK